MPRVLLEAAAVHASPISAVWGHTPRGERSAFLKPMTPPGRKMRMSGSGDAFPLIARPAALPGRPF